MSGAATRQHGSPGGSLDMERQADALLAGVPQDPEAPFYPESQLLRQDEERGRHGCFRRVTLTELVRSLDDPVRQVESLDAVEALLEHASLTDQERSCFLLRLYLGLGDREIGMIVGRARQRVVGYRASAQAKLKRAYSALQGSSRAAGTA